MAPQGRMRGAFVVAARKRVTMADLPLISQWSGPLTASPKGEASTTKSRSFPTKLRLFLWRTRAQHIYYTTFDMEQSILIMHKYCI